MIDVVVVGGGPAGLVAARDLARGGHAVSVIEEHPTVGEPVHCTGLLGVEAFSELQLPRGSIRRTTRAARFHAASGRSVRVESERVGAAVVDRAAFDAALAGEAAAAGAEIRTGLRAVEIAPSAGGVRVDVEASGRADALRARACVLACGANYRFNRRLGFGVPRAFVQSAQLETRFAPVPDVQVFLGHQLAPDGFGWLVPFDRAEQPYARIGLMCRTRAAERFAAFARGLARAHGFAGGLPGPRIRLLPLAPVARTYTTRVVAVGDAAGLVKPTTGGGIYYSLLSGSMAAGVLDRCLRTDTLDEGHLAEYERRWRARLGPEMRAGLAFRRLAARLNDRAIDAVVELAASDGIVPLLLETADFNWHRRAVVALLRHAGFRGILRLVGSTFAPPVVAEPSPES